MASKNLLMLFNFTSNEMLNDQPLKQHSTRAREDKGVRELLPHIGPIPILIPLELFLVKMVGNSN